MRQRLLTWYRSAHRKLPWRDTHDPYRILVSEVMLQQTQVDRVVPKYHEFLALFPDIAALADAPPSEVIRAWAGLGYNRRALGLHRTARAVMDEYGGTLPACVDELKKLPGIGPYTAGAIACFAYRQDVGFIDTNIRRVLHRVIAGPDVPDPQMTARELEAIAQHVVPAGDGYEWNQALMELGATICRARAVRCDICPLAADCQARPTIAGILTEQPRRRTASEPRFETTNRYVRGRILDILRNTDGRGASIAEIERLMPDGAHRPHATRIASMLDAMVSEGLVMSGSAVAEDAEPYDQERVSESSRYRLPD
ncbi:MAG: A/G-specific adenine glycosylase [Thermomicrobiales bacterium]|nr:A/G-specific adenine glycosylase [Thermomicrobiales bacterium]